MPMGSLEVKFYQKEEKFLEVENTFRSGYFLLMNHKNLHNQFTRLKNNFFINCYLD